MPKSLTCGSQQTGKFLKRWDYQTTWPAFWEICMQVKKQQLELDTEQQTGSKLGKGYVKAVGEGNGNPLQYSCLQNPMDRRAWWATVYIGLQRVGHDWCDITHKAFDCVDHNKQWKILKEMGILDHFTCLLENLYARSRKNSYNQTWNNKVVPN